MPCPSWDSYQLSPATVIGKLAALLTRDLSLSLQSLPSTASPLWKTSPEKDKMPDLRLKGNIMYLEITCFQEIQNNLLKVLLELASFSFRVTCLY